MTHVTVNHLTIDGGFYCATQSAGIWNFYILKLYRYLFAIEKIFSIFLSFNFAFFCGVENSLGQNVTYVTYMLRSFKRPYFSVKLKAMKNQLRYDFSLIIYIIFFYRYEWNLVTRNSTFRNKSIFKCYGTHLCHTISCMYHTDQILGTHSITCWHSSNFATIGSLAGVYPSSFTNVRFLNKDWVFECYKTQVLEVL